MRSILVCLLGVFSLGHSIVSGLPQVPRSDTSFNITEIPASIEARAFSKPKGSGQWPNGIVWYRYANDADETALSGWVGTAITNWHAVAPWLQFRKLAGTGDSNGVLTIRQEPCGPSHADVGYDASKATHVSLHLSDPSCPENTPSGADGTTHELGHALGMGSLST